MGLDQPELSTTTETIAKLKGHYILCGAGRTGYYISREFLRRRTPCVVIDEDPTLIASLQERLYPASDPSLLYIEGDATEDEVLEAAGIRRAQGLITALDDDKDNLFVILTARSLNPYIRIVTGVNNEINREKLQKAGADRVISTYAIGGLRTASEMIRPEVVDFLDQLVRVTEKTKALHLIELPLADIKTPELISLIEASQQEPHASKVRVKDIGKYTGLLVIAVKSPDHHDDTWPDDSDDFYEKRRSYQFTPRGDVELESGDILVVIGAQDQLDAVRGNLI